MTHSHMSADTDTHIHKSRTVPHEDDDFMYYRGFRMNDMQFVPKMLLAEHFGHLPFWVPFIFCAAVPPLVGFQFCSDKNFYWN